MPINVSVKLNMMSYHFIIVKMSVKSRNIKFFILLEQFEIKIKTKHFHEPFIYSPSIANLGILCGYELMSFEINHILSFRTINLECNGRVFLTLIPYKMYVSPVSTNPSFFFLGHPVEKLFSF